MKKFNLEQAKAGKPVCTRSGQPARIVCFDREHSNNFSIVALIKDTNIKGESVLTFNNKGHYIPTGSSDMDLMMVSEKHVGWINIYPGESNNSTGGTIYESKFAAEDAKHDANGITIKIEWED